MSDIDFAAIARKVAVREGLIEAPPEPVKPKRHQDITIVNAPEAEPIADLPGFEPMVIPDVAGTVQGWRAWGLRFGAKPGGAPDPHLASVTKRTYIWKPREVQVATCQRNNLCKSSKPNKNVQVPGETCTCGLYSAKTFEHLTSMSYHQYHGEEYKIVGQVANWGKVIEGTQGWRSEMSYPVLLWVPFTAWKFAADLQDAYGVPVKLQNFLKTTKGE